MNKTITCVFRQWIDASERTIVSPSARRARRRRQKSKMQAEKTAAQGQHTLKAHIVPDGGAVKIDRHCGQPQRLGCVWKKKKCLIGRGNQGAVC